MALVEEQEVACVLEYTYVLYGRFGVGEMEQMRARNYTTIFVCHRGQKIYQISS